MGSRSKAHPVVSIEYAEFLRAIKQRIQTSRVQAYRAINRELIDLYWTIRISYNLLEKSPGAKTSRS
jgi:hypothetical protein